ncbi:hypothetical protein [Enterobacter ludwigii]|uniref:hypothetical protein n=1 Tax=Enterobacter ludwigii TaxID=299767 RepID=UPI003F710185
MSQNILKKDDICIVTAADYLNNGFLVQGNYFRVKVDNFERISAINAALPVGDESNEYWEYVPDWDNQHAHWKLYTKDKTGRWRPDVHVGKGSVFQVTPEDVASNPGRGLIAGNCFVAKSDFVAASNSFYPSGDDGNSFWEFDGREPLRTRGRPGDRLYDASASKGDVFLVTPLDADKDRNLTLGNYFRASDDFPRISDKPYPGHNESNAWWDYAGDRWPHTRENPGTWASGRNVNREHIYRVTESDVKNNTKKHLVLGNYFQAVQSFTLSGAIADYPARSRGDNNWRFIGNDQPYTEENPGVWLEGGKVKAGEIFMVRDDDLLRAPGDLIGGNYFRALESFTMGPVPDYPAGCGGSDHWQYAGSDNPKTRLQPGVWALNKTWPLQVDKGDIYRVTSADAGQSTHPTVDYYFQAIKPFEIKEDSSGDGGKNYFYPTGYNDSIYWKCVTRDRQHPGIWALNTDVATGDVFRVTQNDVTGQSTNPTVDYYFQARSAFTITESLDNKGVSDKGKPYFYPTGYSDSTYWTCIALGRQKPGEWRLDAVVGVGDIYRVTQNDVTGQSTNPTVDYYFQARSAFTITESLDNKGVSDKGKPYFYPTGYSDSTYWTCVTRDRLHPESWALNTEVAKGDVFQVTPTDTGQSTHPTGDFYFQAKSAFTITASLNDKGVSDNGKSYFYPPEYNNGLYWTCIACGRRKPGTATDGADTQVIVGKGDIFRVTAENAVHQSTHPTEDAYFRARQGFIITGDVYEYHFPAGYGESDQWVCVTRDRGHPGVWALYAEVAEEDVFQVRDVDVKHNPHCTKDNYFQASEDFNINEVIDTDGKSDNGEPYFFPDGDSSNKYWVFSERNKANPGVWATGDWVSAGDIFMVTSADVARNQKNYQDCVLDCFFQALQDFEITAAAAHDFPAGFSSNEYWQCVTSGTFGQPASWDDHKDKPVYQYDVFKVTSDDAVKPGFSHLVEGMYFIAQQDEPTGCGKYPYPETGDLRDGTFPPLQSGWGLWRYPDYVGINTGGIASGGSPNGPCTLYTNGRHQARGDISVSSVKVRWPGYPTTVTGANKEVSISGAYLTAATLFVDYQDGCADHLSTYSDANEYYHPVPSSVADTAVTTFPLYLSVDEDVGAVGCRITLGAWRQYNSKSLPADAGTKGVNNAATGQLSVNYKAPVDYSASSNGTLTSLSISDIVWHVVNPENNIFWTVWISDNGPRYQYTSGSLQKAQVTITSSVPGLPLKTVTADPVGNGWPSGPAGLSLAADAVLSWSRVDSGSSQPYYGGNAMAWYVQPEAGKSIGFTRLCGQGKTQDGLKGGTTFKSDAGNFTYQVYLGTDSPKTNPAGLTASTGQVTVAAADLHTDAINLTGVRINLPVEANLGQDANTSYAPANWSEGSPPRTVTVTDVCGNQSRLQIAFATDRPAIIVTKAP